MHSLNQLHKFASEVNWLLLTEAHIYNLDFYAIPKTQFRLKFAYGGTPIYYLTGGVTESIPIELSDKIEAIKDKYN